MTLLGLGSAGKIAAAAVWRDGRMLASFSLGAGLTHSQTLLPLCDGALRAAGLTMDDVTSVAVTAGPGSFTGLRIGLAMAKGLCFARGLPCAGVSTLEALAWELPVDGCVLCALDARRGEVYCAAFCVQGGKVRRLCEDHAAGAAQLLPLVQSMASPVYLMGDGAHLVYGALADKAPLVLVDEPLRLGSAAGVCRCALAHPEAFGDADALAPQYHRLSQAQRERAERLAKEAAAPGAPGPSTIEKQERI